MKKLILASALAAGLIGFAPVARGSELSVTAIIHTHGLSSTEAAAAVILADALNLDASFVISTGRRTGQSLVILGPAFVISSYTRVPVYEVWKRKKHGKGWGVVAKECGMHPGAFNKMRVQGDFDRVCWVNLVNRRYRYSPSLIVDLEKRGMRDRDWITAAAYSNGNRARLAIVANDWKKDRNWKSAEKRYGGKGWDKVRGNDDQGKDKSKEKGHGKDKHKGKGWDN